MLGVVRLLEAAKRQKQRSNSGLSQRELLDSGIDIMETNGELYSDQKEQASRRSVEAQLYAAGLTCSPPPCSLPRPPYFPRSPSKAVSLPSVDCESLQRVVLLSRCALNHVGYDMDYECHVRKSLLCWHCKRQSL